MTRCGIILSARTKKDNNDNKRRIQMKRLLLTISKFTAMEIPLAPILLCFAVASSDVATFYHNLVVLTVGCAIVSFVTFVAAQVVD